MAAIQLTYKIFLSDPTAYAAAIATLGPTGMFWGPPTDARSGWSAPIVGVDFSGGPEPTPDIRIDSVVDYAPGIGTSITGYFDPWQMATVFPGGLNALISQRGFFNVTFPQGFFNPGNYGPASNAVTLQFVWVGFILLRAATTTPAAVQKKMGPRRFVEGFELATMGDSPTQGDRTRVARCASRSVDGFGYAIRKAAGLSGPQHFQNPTNADPFPNASSERFYIRLLTLPVGGEDQIWFASGRIQASTGANLTVDSAGRLKAYNQSLAGFPGNLIGQTAALTLNTWYRVDILTVFSWHSVSGSAATPGFFLWLNGASAVSQQGGIGGTEGLNTVQAHRLSQLGNQQGTSFGLECDIDDWVGADPVVTLAAPVLTNIGGFNGYAYDFQVSGISHGFDLTSGSHVICTHPTKVGPSNAGWTGDWREAINNPTNNVDANSALSSSVPAATLDLQTDYNDQQFGCPIVGAAVFTPVGITTSQLGVVSPTFGTALTSVSTNAGTAARAVKTTAGTLFAGNILTPMGTAAGTTPQGLPTTPIPALQSLRVQFVKSNDATNVTISGLLAVAEIVGLFGPEDNSSVTQQLSPIGYHNAPYPTRTGQNSVSRPATGVTINAGIYTGNNIGQDVLAGLAPHWWFVRPLSGASDGVFWFSTLMAAHGYLNQLWRPNRMVQATLDTIIAQAPVMRVDGPGAQANATAVSYQWVAVSDPGMRFMLNGVFAHISTDAGPTNNPLVDSGFTPEAAFLFLESSANSATGDFFKGVGHPANQASPLDGATNNNVAGFAAGIISSLAAIHGVPQTAFSAWRRNDGLGVTTFFDLVTYQGNGSGANRSIACNLGGNSPLFAILVPHNGTSYFRDPSHTGLNSTNMSSGGLITTAIVGGDINTVIVNTTGNANGITYDLFVLAGNPNPGNWGTNPPQAVTPVPPAQPPGNGPYSPPGVQPAPVDAGCIALSTAITELAYRLGDPLGVHWTSAELTRYLLESLRVYNALTCTYRDRGTFPTAAGVAFYDLPSVLKDQATGTVFLRGYNLKDQDLVLDLEYSLMEPASTTTWTGTAMFSLNTLVQPMQRRRDRFLWETGLVVVRQTTAVTPDANGRVVMPLTTVQLRRAAWNDGTRILPLYREGEWNANAYQRNWPTAVATNAVNPWAYSVSVTPPLNLQLMPPPNAIGTLDTLGVALGNNLDPTVGVLLGVPDDFAWVLKWGVIADIFGGEGPSRDPLRESIADSLWKLGIDAARKSAVILDGFQGTPFSPLPIHAISDADTFLRTWQSTNGALGTGSRILTAGGNLVAVTPVPTGIATVTLDVVRNQKVPVLTTDCFFEGGVAITNALLDYAQFVAMFKEGPSQAQEGLPYLQRFLQMVGVALERDSALTRPRGAILSQNQQDERTSSPMREAPPEDTTV